MKCSYAYYVGEGKPRARIYCKVNSMPCINTRFCVNANKYLPKDKEMENCSLIMDNKRDKIPTGSHYVRFIRNGFLYIENGDSVLKVKNTLNREDIEYVYVRKVNDEYEISTTPFQYEVVKEEKPVIVEKPVVVEEKPKGKKKTTYTKRKK